MAFAPPDGFDTARLKVRAWDDDPADPAARNALEAGLAELLHPDVTRHLPPPLQLDEGAGAVDRWIDRNVAGASVYTVCDADGLAGLLILAVPAPGDDRPDVHIGYLIARDRWGRGLASELVGGLVSALQGKASRLVGGVGRGNTASARVLEKAGFAQDGAASTPDTTIYSRRVD